MKLFGNRDSQKMEQMELQAEEAGQAAVEESKEAAEKAEAIAKSGLVLSIEGLSQETAASETVPLSINTEPYREPSAEDADDDFLRELHALLDEKEKDASDRVLSADEPESEEAEPLTAKAEAPVEEPEAAPIPEAEPEVAEEEAPIPEAEPEAAEEEAPAAEPEPDADPVTAEEPEDPAAETEELFQTSAADAFPEAETVPAAASEKEPAPSEEPIPETKSFASVTYASMAQAMEQSGQSKSASPTRRARSAIDDETLLAEIYTLMGETPRTRASSNRSEGEIPASQRAAAPVDGLQENPQAPIRVADPEQATVMPAPQTVPEQEVRPNPVGYQTRQPVRGEQVPIPVRESGGAPGWLKGAFLLLLSAALSGMTIYAVMMDVLGKVF